MQSSLKILFITHRFYPNVGGTEANAEFLAQAFHDRGACVHLLTWTAENGEKEFPYTVIRNPGTRLVLKEHAWANIVFENSPVLRLSWPAMFLRKPLVVVLNTWLSNEDGSKSIQARMKYWWLKKASTVISVSNEIKKQCWPLSTVIGNAYNDELFTNTTDDQSRPKSFVFLGRLVSDKGADMAVEAIAQLNRMYQKSLIVPNNISLTIIGDGKDSGKLKQQVKEQGLENQVTFTGSLTGKELVNCLNQHQYMLIPSRWKEPFGIVALEGMASGCIPIVADGGGLPDAVGNAGLVFKRGDVNDLVRTMRRVLIDENLKTDLRNAAPQHLKAHTTEKVAGQYFDIIEAAATNKNRVI
jgi:glycosyltransferase involved in cell wall biosynthesis